MSFKEFDLSEYIEALEQFKMKRARKSSNIGEASKTSISLFKRSKMMSQTRPNLPSNSSAVLRSIRKP